MSKCMHRSTPANRRPWRTAGPAVATILSVSVTAICTSGLAQGLHKALQCDIAATSMSTDANGQMAANPRMTMQATIEFLPESKAVFMISSANASAIIYNVLVSDSAYVLTLGPDPYVISASFTIDRTTGSLSGFDKVQQGKERIESNYLGTCHPVSIVPKL